MKKPLIALLILASTCAFASDKKERTSFLDGSKLECTAMQEAGTAFIQKKMEILYRVDAGNYDMAYFKQVVQIGNYTFDGSCSPHVCDIEIRDLRTNTVSDMNASFAELNNNSLQIQISSFKEDLTSTMKCQLIKN
jgi:hypothetical protein